MTSTVRLILAGLLVALGAWGYILVSEPAVEDPASPDTSDLQPPDTTAHGRMELRSSKDCQACHPAVYQEWLDSQHEYAWLNPEPRRRELSDNFRNKDCIPCHAPRPLIEVGFGKRALERESHREDGVNCFTCHRYQNVHVAANPLSEAAGAAPCNPVEWPGISEVKLCTPCHDQHKVEQDWLRSRFAVRGSPEYRDCNDCHMPRVPGPGTQGGSRKTHRSHRFAGGHDASMVKQAGIMRAVKVEGGESIATVAARVSGRSWKPEKDAALARGIFVEVKNTGTGHNFPADERHRAVDLFARWIPKSGKTRDPVLLARFRNPYRHEFELTNPFKDKPFIPLAKNMTWAGEEFVLTQVRILPDFNPGRKVFYPESTQLHAGESRFLWFELPDWGAGDVELTLYYKLQPFLKNEDAILISQTRLSF